MCIRRTKAGHSLASGQKPKATKGFVVVLSKIERTEKSIFGKHDAIQQMAKRKLRYSTQKSVLFFKIRNVTQL